MLLASRVLSGFLKNSFNQAPLSLVSPQPSIVSSILEPPQQKVTVLRQSVRGFWSWFSSKGSPQPSENEANQPADGQDTARGESNASTAVMGNPSIKDLLKLGNPSIEDLVKLAAEKEELLKLKQKEIHQMEEKLLLKTAEIKKLETAFSRTKQEAAIVDKVEVQKFAKNILHVAENLGRVSSAVKDTLSNIYTSKDTIGAVPIIKLLLQNVEETEKQLLEMLPSSTYADDFCISSVTISSPKRAKKYDPRRVEKYNPRKVEKYYPTPYKASKPAGTF